VSGHYSPLPVESAASQNGSTRIGPHPIGLEGWTFPLRPRRQAGDNAASMKTRTSLLVLAIRGLATLVLAILASWPLDLATAQDKPEMGSAKILALEDKWNAAYKRGDIATMESLLADNFIITLEDGSTFSKSGYLAHNGDPTVHIETTEGSGLSVRMHGNTAVVTGAYHEKGTSKGKAYEYHDRFTDVWMNLNGKWQVIVSHYSIPSN
jgi:ketosteroid isomerase-like protein